mmetsp:Transcript_13783/g.30534  ORF Transcript_13783/g.30534 Transcript_13783/m.30534 type:complete len:246 (+) Transcript_13783:149-886(+)
MNLGCHKERIPCLRLTWSPEAQERGIQVSPHGCLLHRPVDVHARHRHAEAHHEDQHRSAELQHATLWGLLDQRAGWRCSAPPSLYFAGAHLQAIKGGLHLTIKDLVPFCLLLRGESIHQRSHASSPGDKLGHRLRLARTLSAGLGAQRSHRRLDQSQRIRRVGLYRSVHGLAVCLATLLDALQVLLVVLVDALKGWPLVHVRNPLLGSVRLLLAPLLELLLSLAILGVVGHILLLHALILKLLPL